MSPLSVITREEAVSDFVAAAEKEVLTFAATPNAEILLESRENPALKKYLQACDLNFPDSVSLRWAAECVDKDWSKPRALVELWLLLFRKKYWTALPQTVTGADTFEPICAKAAEKGISVALIGGGEGVAETTAQKLQEKIKSLKITAHVDGLPFSDFDKPEVLESLEGARIIFVALGCPRQELWIQNNLKKIKSARIALGIGGTFDFYIGKTARAPQWMRSAGLEWLFRLFKEPARWKRVLNALVVFPWVFLKGR